MLGRLAAGARDGLVIATKYGLQRPGAANTNAAGSQRKSLRRSIEASLQRLRTDHIDLLWLHAWDGLTPVDEVMRALDDAVRAGQLLHVGVSNTPAWVVAQANTLAELRGWTPFVGLQVEYILVERSAERELLPMAHALGLGVAAWSPLASGVLSGKYADGATTGDDKRLAKAPLRTLDERSLVRVPQLDAHGRGHAIGGSRDACAGCVAAGVAVSHGEKVSRRGASCVNAARGDRRSGPRRRRGDRSASHHPARSRACRRPCRRR